MEDSVIIELYLGRDESAIAQTQQKYGKQCYKIAYNILGNKEDCEECVNDMLVKVWNRIPPDMPHNLFSYIAKMTRNLSLNRYSEKKAAKRGGGQTEAALSELEECIPSGKSVEDECDDNELRDVLNGFLGSLSIEKRTVFMQRYWYLMPIREIAQKHGCESGRIKMMLSRIRKELKLYLEKEGITL